MCKPCELHKLVIVPNLLKIVERDKKKILYILLNFPFFEEEKNSLQISILPGFLPGFCPDFARIFVKNPPGFRRIFAKMSPDEELVALRVPPGTC